MVLLVISVQSDASLRYYTGFHEIPCCFLNVCGLIGPKWLVKLTKTTGADKDNTTTDFMWWMIRISPYWLVRMVGQGPETNSDGLTSDFSPTRPSFEILLGISRNPVLFRKSVCPGGCSQNGVVQNGLKISKSKSPLYKVVRSRDRGVPSLTLMV